MYSFYLPDFNRGAVACMARLGDLDCLEIQLIHLSILVTSKVSNNFTL